MVKVNRKKNIVTVTGEDDIALIVYESDSEAQMVSGIVRSSFNNKRKKRITYTFTEVVESIQAFKLGTMDIFSK